MKKIYFLFAFLSMFTMHAQQTIVDFTAAEGFTNTALESHTPWGGEFWSVNPDPAKEWAITTANGAKAYWGQAFTVEDTSISFHVTFQISGEVSPPGTLKGQVGFNTGGTSLGTKNFVFLSTLNDGSLHVRKGVSNTPLSSMTSMGLDQYHNDELVLEVSLNLGVDAASTEVAARLKNLSTGTQTGVGTYTGVEQAIFDAASTGIYGFFRTNSVKVVEAGDQFFKVLKVTMEQGNTLSNDDFKKSQFNLSTNPIKNAVSLTGVSFGTPIKLYSVTGTLVFDHSYNGVSVDLSHLNKGLYLMSVEGFKAKKIIKQ